MSNADDLKSSGLKATLPRIKILEVFQHTQRRHMTAEDVYKTLLGEGADIGLATVYRVLMQFEQAGLEQHGLFLGDGIALHDVDAVRRDQAEQAVGALQRFAPGQGQGGAQKKKGSSHGRQRAECGEPGAGIGSTLGVMPGWL